MVHVVECNNMAAQEKILHSLLKANGHHLQKEVFRIKEHLIIDYLDFVATLDKKLPLFEKPGYLKALTTALGRSRAR